VGSKCCRREKAWEWEMETAASVCNSEARFMNLRKWNGGNIDLNSASILIGRETRGRSSRRKREKINEMKCDE
jgi:hypothetical protein